MRETGGKHMPKGGLRWRGVGPRPFEVAHGCYSTLRQHKLRSSDVLRFATFSPLGYLSEMIRIPRRLIYAVRAEVVPRILILILISPLLTREVRSKCRLSRRTDVEHKFSIFGKFQSSFSPSGGKEEKRD